MHLERIYCRQHNQQAQYLNLDVKAATYYMCQSCFQVYPQLEHVITFGSFKKDVSQAFQKLLLQLPQLHRADHYLTQLEEDKQRIIGQIDSMKKAYIRKLGLQVDLLKYQPLLDQAANMQLDQTQTLSSFFRELKSQENSLSELKIPSFHQRLQLKSTDTSDIVLPNKPKRSSNDAMEEEIQPWQINSLLKNSQCPYLIQSLGRISQLWMAYNTFIDNSQTYTMQFDIKFNQNQQNKIAITLEDSQNTRIATFLIQKDEKIISQQLDCLALVYGMAIALKLKISKLIMNGTSLILEKWVTNTFQVKSLHIGPYMSLYADLFKMFRSFSYSYLPKNNSHITTVMLNNQIMSQNDIITMIPYNLIEVKVMVLYF